MDEFPCGDETCPCCNAWDKYTDDLMRAINGDIVLPPQKSRGKKRIKMTLTSEA